jgi:HK97 gp10 family phage protein
LSAQIHIDVQYARELARALREHFPDALDTHVSQAVQTVGERMANTARQFCPVRTGFLRSSIELDQPTGAKWVFSLWARAPYAAFVEWGTTRTPPRLFMTHAVQLHQFEMLWEVNNAVTEAIREVLR